MRAASVVHVVAILGLAYPAGTSAASREVSAVRIDDGLKKAALYLLSKQSADGAWRSETYGAMRDGPSLTPLMMSALLFLPQGGDAGQTALRKGADYLTGFVDERGHLK